MKVKEQVDLNLKKFEISLIQCKNRAKKSECKNRAKKNLHMQKS